MLYALPALSVGRQQRRGEYTRTHSAGRAAYAEHSTVATVLGGSAAIFVPNRVCIEVHCAFMVVSPVPQILINCPKDFCVFENDLWGSAHGLECTLFTFANDGTTRTVNPSRRIGVKIIKFRYEKRVCGVILRVRSILSSF